jgi:hypothetical protein
MYLASGPIATTVIQYFPKSSGASSMPMEMLALPGDHQSKFAGVGGSDLRGVQAVDGQLHL